MNIINKYQRLFKCRLQYQKSMGGRLSNNSYSCTIVICTGPELFCDRKVCGVAIKFVTVSPTIEQLFKLFDRRPSIKEQQSLHITGILSSTRKRLLEFTSRRLFRGSCEADVTHLEI